MVATTRTEKTDIIVEDITLMWGDAEGDNINWGDGLVDDYLLVNRGNTASWAAVSSPSAPTRTPVPSI